MLKLIAREAMLLSETCTTLMDMAENSFLKNASSFVFGAPTATSELNTDAQPQATVVVEATPVVETPAMPVYMTELSGLKITDVSKRAGYDGVEHNMRLISVVATNAGSKDGMNLCLTLELLDYRTATEAFLFTEERVVYGLRSIAQCQIEFAKYRATQLAKKGLQVMPQYHQLFNTLEGAGWTVERLTGKDNKPSKIITKLFHILEDCDMLDVFQTELNYDLLALKGANIRAKMSERGALMSCSGVEKSDDAKSTQEKAPVDSAGTADYGLNFG